MEIGLELKIRRTTTRKASLVTALCLRGAEVGGDYTFEIGSSRSDHESIRRLMRAEYGWRDWWIGLVFDTSSSMRVKLKPTRQTTLDG